MLSIPSLHTVSHISYTVVIHYARHLAFFYVLVGLNSDNPGPACPDSGAWILVSSYC